MRLNEFRHFVYTNWEKVERMSIASKLVNVYKDKIIGID